MLKHKMVSLNKNTNFQILHHTFEMVHQFKLFNQHFKTFILI